ncbi:MAG: glutamine amidotransferase, partial [Candidatus Solincola sediminis]
MLIVKNIAREGPGILGEIVRERGIASETIELDQRQRFPPVDRYDAIVILGGPDSANDKNDKMREELARLREAMDIRKPCLGVCLGLQALVKTAGSRVAPSPVKEVGFRDPEGELYKIELTEKGRHDPLFQGLGSSFHVFQLHGETVELADGMLLLAAGK